MTKPFQTRPYALNAQAGTHRAFRGATVSVKASAEQTGGAFNLFEAVCPPGFDTPLHIHYAEHVALYVLEGSLSLFWGSEKREALAGSWFFQPQGTPHGFRVDGAEPARILYLTIPAGFDRFITEQAQAVRGRALETAAARYQIEILGPLPE